MRETNHMPYSDEIQMAEISEKFQIPRFKQYVVTMDLLEHMQHFHNQMAMYTGSDVLMCRAFPASLEQGALEWF